MAVAAPRAAAKMIALRRRRVVREIFTGCPSRGVAWLYAGRASYWRVAAWRMRRIPDPDWRWWLCSSSGPDPDRYGPDPEGPGRGTGVAGPFRPAGGPNSASA